MVGCIAVSIVLGHVFKDAEEIQDSSEPCER